MLKNRNVGFEQGQYLISRLKGLPARGQNFTQSAVSCQSWLDQVGWPIPRAHVIPEQPSKTVASAVQSPEQDYCSNLSIALANPSSWFELVIKVANICTSLPAFPIAMPTPLFLNINTSFGMSPIAAIWSGGVPQICENIATTSPLLAFGWVTSGGKTYMARSKNVADLGAIANDYRASR